jgi:hypothetical protein
MFDKDYETVKREWIKDFVEYHVGPGVEIINYDAPFWDEAGNPPDERYYRVPFSSAPCYQIYETVSEGTPVSPVFTTEHELVKWLVEQGYSEKAANEFVKMGSVPSMMVAGGRIYQDISMCDADKDR